MKLCRAVLLLILPALVLRAAEAVPVDLLPPGTRILIGCALRSLVDSPLVKDIGADIGKADLSQAKISLGDAAGWAGVNPLKDLDSVVLAADGSGKNARGLAVLRGRFPAEPLANAKTYHGVPMLEDPKNPNGSLAVLDAVTAIAGSPAEVRAAIDRRGKASAPAPGIAARFAELAASYDFWGVGDLPEGMTPAPETTKELQSIDHFEFGATLRDGLRFRGEFHARTAQQAVEMQSLLRMIEGMLKAKSPAGGGNFDLRVENGSLKVELFVPEAELRKAVVAQKGNLAGMLQRGMGGIGPAGAARPVLVQGNEPVPRSLGATVTDSRGDTVTVKLPGAH
jgi:hypothetical protein